MATVGWNLFNDNGDNSEMLGLTVSILELKLFSEETNFVLGTGSSLDLILYFGTKSVRAGSILELKLFSEETNFVPGTESTLELK